MAETEVVGIDPSCRCKGTGWVRTLIPIRFPQEYSDRSEGWVGCVTHYWQADPEPPADA